MLRLPTPFSQTVSRKSPGWPMTTLTILSPSSRFGPLTPRALRPMSRTTVSSIRTAVVRETEQIIMRVGNEQMFRKIFIVFAALADDAFAAAALHAVARERLALGVTLVRNRDGHDFVGDEIHFGNVTGLTDDHR